MKNLLLISFLAIFLFSSCKKDKDVSLQGKWNVENYTFKEYSNGSLKSTDVIPGAGGTMDFRNDGTVVVSQSGTTETYSYEVLSGSRVEIDGEIVEIRGLTSSSVTLYGREDLSATESLETFVNLKR